MRGTENVMVEPDTGVELPRARQGCTRDTAAAKVWPLTPSLVTLQPVTSKSSLKRRLWFPFGRKWIFLLVPGGI